MEKSIRIPIFPSEFLLFSSFMYIIESKAQNSAERKTSSNRLFVLPHLISRAESLPIKLRTELALSVSNGAGPEKSEGIEFFEGRHFRIRILIYKCYLNFNR